MPCRWCCIKHFLGSYSLSLKYSDLHFTAVSHCNVGLKWTGKTQKQIYCWLNFNCNKIISQAPQLSDVITAYQCTGFQEAQHHGIRKRIAIFSEKANLNKFRFWFVGKELSSQVRHYASQVFLSLLLSSTGLFVIFRHPQLKKKKRMCEVKKVSYYSHSLSMQECNRIKGRRR